MKILVLVTVILSYLLFFVFPARRAIVSVAAAALVALFGLITGTFPVADVARAVNWNVMGIFVGTLFLADIFTYSRAPAVLAERMVNRAGSAGSALIAICILSSVISAFVENVATVLIVAPIALAVCDRIKVNPVLPIIAIALSSNLQGTATMIGDPPSMILAGYANMNFNDFFIYHGRPGIFFAVQVGALTSFFVLWIMFRRFTVPVEVECVEKVRHWIPVILLVAMIVLLALSSFADPAFGHLAGIICMILGLLGFVWYVVDCRQPLREFIKGLDWETAFFLAGIFILVGALTRFGWIDAMATGLQDLIGSNRFLAFCVIVLGSVAISAVVDNVPYLAAMIPLAQRMAEGFGNTAGSGEVRVLLLFGLLIGSCLGGNITPVGASANIVGIGILKKRGHCVRFGEFVRIGLPFTMAAVIPSAVFLWLVWA